MDYQVKEWIYIQNIVVEKTYNNFLLDELYTAEQDICEHMNCECIIYKNTCVFEVIDSMHLSKVQLTTAVIDIYYCMVRSVQTHTIYVLFSSGIVLNENELHKNKELNDRLMILISKLIAIVKSNPNMKFVLGGHSMGGVLGAYTGWIMYNNPKFKTYFINNGYVIGTASAKWLYDKDHSYHNLPNIRMFLSGELRISKNKKTLLLDCFVNEGDANKKVYEPIEIIYRNTDDGIVELKRFSDIDPSIQIVYTEKTSSQCKKLHMFSYYQNLLYIVYQNTSIPKVNIPYALSQITNPKTKSKTQKNRKSYKQTD
jgi:hypothetical protein